ncbi:MAG TPA: cytochrome c [Solirubrobacteraceae bacterium]|nr:cytochrome c [Solirubrobacteraceae bacterium]
MLGVALLIAFWVVLGLGTFFIAINGGLRGARSTLQSKSRSGTRLGTLVMLILYAGFGLAIPITLLTGNHANASNQFDGVKLNASDKQGRVLFGQHCATCHTLAAANATGKVGPNLDVLQPPKQLVLSTIKNGLNIGTGTMPQGLVVGKDANDVANFVSTVAGK